MKAKFLATVLFATSISTVASADSIFDAMSLSYETNPSLRAQRAYLRSVDENISIAKSGYRPDVYLQGSYSNADNHSSNNNSLTLASQGLDNRSTTYGAQVVQPLFSGLSTVNSVKAADSYIRSEQENLNNVEQQVLLSAAEAYLKVLQDAMIVELQKNNELLLKKRLDETKGRFEVGALTMTDVSQSEARYSRAKAGRISAEGDLEASRAAYVKIVGVEPQELEEPTKIISMLPDRLDDAIRFAQENNYSVRQAKHVMDSKEHEVNANVGALMPQVNFNAGATTSKVKVQGPQNDGDIDSFQWGVNAKVPLYSSGADRAKIRQAKYQKWQAQELIMQADRQAVSDVRSYWEYVLANKASIGAIGSQIKANEIALDGVQKEEAVGNRTVLDVLDAYQELLNSNVEEVKARTNYYLSSMQLLLAMGKFTAQDLGLNVEQYDAKKHFKDTRDKLFSLSIDD
ncbi:MAG: TolC family outer membrane protein [Alphaproteobacteria bacterium]|nr:TolC family outer membrane protein [Alphaproteobacteria bacterium]